MEQLEYWNTLGPAKRFTTPFDLDGFRKYAKTDAWVIDVGCGYGRLLEELHEAGFDKLTGIDFSQTMVEAGRDAHPYLDLRVAKGTDTGLPQDSADAVLLFGVLTCIADDREQEILISEVRRILKPGGIPYASDFLLNPDERHRARYGSCESRYDAEGVFELSTGTPFRHHSESRVRMLLAGFEELEYKSFVCETMNGNHSNAFSFIGKLLR